MTRLLRSPRGTVSGPTEVDAAGRVAAAWRELRRCSRQLRERAQATEREPLDTSQLDGLEFLIQRTGWRMSELASALRVDASTATRVVDSLVSAGLAERTRATDDARCVMAAATPRGRRRYAAHEEHRRTIMRALLAEFSERDRERMASLMEDLVSAVDRIMAERLDG
ncbi:MAG: MarR family transcriptional regulator [Actinobacteria bacterium]|nr:MarR family transcriptional regulator [Actinomycetota bacterium]